MNDETKQQINKRYERELEKGERFWPDSIFKDVIMALAIFVLLVLLATFVGIAPDPKADPSDATYVPRPEWYFLFLFKFLGLYGQIPLLGKIEWIAVVVVPLIALAVLTLLPFIEKSPIRYYGKRILPISVMAIFVVSMVQLTLLSDVATGGTDAFGPLRDTLQTVGGLVIPFLAYIALFVMGLKLKASTKTMIWTAGTTIALMVVLTTVILVINPAPAAAEEVAIATTIEEQIIAGQDSYSVNCVECHGEDGSTTKIEGVEGLEGKEIPPINGKDILYTVNDASMAEVIAYGRPDAGMNPFGKAYNPEGISRAEIDYIVVFMRYMWDDRFEKPQLKPLFPALADGEVPSYEVHIAPIVKRYCISCHRPGKDSHNYLMTTYDEIINTGDEAPVVTAKDPNSILLTTLQGTPYMDPKDPKTELVGTMPPSHGLKPNIVDVFERWVMNGMPQTADEAAKLFVPPGTPTPKP